MTDHQQAAIEAGARAYDPEAWTAYDRESPSTEGRELMVEYSKSKAESILAAAEPHLRKKWAEEASDGYHTFAELYEYRMLYNALAANSMPERSIKSWRNSDGELCFGGGWFVVFIDLPTGQISNHYEAKDWDLFHIPEAETAPVWDGHTPQQAAERLRLTLLEGAGE